MLPVCSTLSTGTWILQRVPESFPRAVASSGPAGQPRLCHVHHSGMKTCWEECRHRQPHHQDRAAQKPKGHPGPLCSSISAPEPCGARCQSTQGFVPCFMEREVSFWRECQHRQQSSGRSQHINSSLQGITHSVNCGMCCSQEASKLSVFKYVQDEAVIIPSSLHKNCIKSRNKPKT